MKNSKWLLIFLWGVVAVAVVVGVFAFYRPKVFQSFSQADLDGAQKVLMTLRRVQKAVGAEQEIFSKIQEGKRIYSKDWEFLRLPMIEGTKGFAYECFPKEGFCEALELRDDVRSGNALRVELDSGVLSCLGAYRAVTTQGMDEKPVVVACRMSE